jgi:uncharacterized protein DUF4440
MLPLVVGLAPMRAAAQSAAAAVNADDSLLVDRERAAWEALRLRDTTAFGRLMGGDVVDVDVSGAKRTTVRSTARYVMGCQTTSYKLADVHVVHFAATVVVSYSATVEQTCWGQKAPSPIYVMTVYERRAQGWAPVAHSETPAAHWR